MKSNANDHLENITALRKANEDLQLDLPFEGKPLKEDPKYNDPLVPNREFFIKGVKAAAKEKARQSYDELLSLGMSPDQALTALFLVWVDFLGETTQAETQREDE